MVTKPIEDSQYKLEKIKPQKNWLDVLRSRFRILQVTIMLVVYGIYQLIFVHGFFVYTFFRPSISDVSPPVDLKIGYWDKLQFKTILIIRHILKDQFWGQLWLKQVHDRIHNQLNQQNVDLTQLRSTIPTVNAEEISGEAFWRTYVQTNTPVIIKGGAKHTSAYKTWSMEMFRERFGNFKVNIANQSKNDELSYGTFKDVVDSKQGDERLYVTFYSNIFSTYPELIDELGCLEFRQYMGGKAALFAGAQLFLGAKAATGSGAHCADGNNLFFQIRGKKKWTFVHPDYLYLMYPMLNRFFLFCGSFLKHDYSDQYLDEYAPLQKYCPKCEAVLEPGDILLNPPWQWHAINNITEDTVAVATRWSLVKQKRSNTLFDFMQLTSSHVWRMKFNLLESKPGKVGNVFNEKVDDLFETKDDFVVMGKKNEMTSWQFDKWPDEYRFASQPSDVLDQETDLNNNVS